MQIYTCDAARGYLIKPGNLEEREEIQKVIVQLREKFPPPKTVSNWFPTRSKSLSGDDHHKVQKGE